MEIEISYCDMCGGIDDAQNVANEIEKHMGLKAKLIDVGRGRFEVTDNGKVVFSKAKEGRFPRPMEIVRRLKRMNS